MLQQSQQVFRDLAEFASDALMLVGDDGRIAYANGYAHAVFGYEPGQLDGLGVELLIPQELRRVHAAHRETYGRSPQLREIGHRNVSLFGMRRNGTRFPAEILLAPIQVDRGLFVAAIVRDTTETEQLMSMRAVALRDAEKANEAKGRLLAAASQDLRQPLQTLRLLNGAMKRLARDPDMQDALEQAERALTVMWELLHALLSIARLDLETQQPTLSEVSVMSLFEELRHQFAALANRKMLKLQVMSPQLYIRSDRVLLSEMLQNLLDNALRYTDRGEVTLRCVRIGADRAVIEVADTGIGIAEAAQARIFEDFFQVAPRGAEHRGGAGLGLGIVRRLSRLLDIPIRVASIVDVGSCFTLEVTVVGQPIQYVA